MYERYLIKDVFEILDTAESVHKILGPNRIDPERIQIPFLRASFELNHGITKSAQGVKHKEEIVKLRLARVAQVYRGTVKEAREMAAIQLSTEYNLACAYMRCDDHAKGEPLLQKCIAIKKKLWTQCLKPQLAGFAEINKNLASIAPSKGDADTAMRHADEAVALIDQWSFGGPGTKVGKFMRFMRACVLYNIGKM